MAIHETRLARREMVAEGTMAFYFSKPSGFRHRAGQSLLMALINPLETDSEGDARTFTIASAPHEAELMIATRMRDTAFKRVLKTAPVGTTVRIDGPNGEMVLHDDSGRPAVFLAGGIGITPFLAMARHAANERLPHRFYLFYSNRRPEDAAFLAELQQLEQRNKNFRLVATMTEVSKSARKWDGETGLINAALLRRFVRDLTAPIYYVAGPPAMVDAMQDMLRGDGIADDAIRSEEFYGY